MVSLASGAWASEDASEDASAGLLGHQVGEGGLTSLLAGEEACSRSVGEVQRHSSGEGAASHQL